jgi:hypothetical protein
MGDCPMTGARGEPTVAQWSYHRKVVAFDRRRTPDWPPSRPDAERAPHDGRLQRFPEGGPTFFRTGELDIATAPILEDTMAAAVAQGGPITSSTLATCILFPARYRF